MLKVWYRQQSLQSGQEVQHQHLQSSIVVRTEIYQEVLLEQIHL